MADREQDVPKRLILGAQIASVFIFNVMAQVLYTDRKVAQNANGEDLKVVTCWLVFGVLLCAFKYPFYCVLNNPFSCFIIGEIYPKECNENRSFFFVFIFQSH